MLIVLLSAVCSFSHIVFEAKQKPYEEGVHYINRLPNLNNSPVFGVLTGSILSVPPELDFGNATDYLGSSYVKFLEMSGARVVPILTSSTHQEIDDILSKVNGVFLPGGESPFWDANSDVPTLAPGESELTCYIYEQVKKINDRGTFFPLWGTCLGFETLHLCIRNEFDTIGNYNGKPSYTAISEFTKSALRSAMFTYRSVDYGYQMMRILGTQKTSLLGHSYGISPRTYELYAPFRDTFEILSIMHDQSDKAFVGIIEAKHYPIFGCQFHPEKNSFEFTKDHYSHEEDGIFATTYLSNFIVSLGRKNNHTFPETELKQKIIYNYPPKFINFVFETIHLFP